MLRIAVLNKSRKDTSSIIYSLSQCNTEHRIINNITVFSSAKELYTALSEGRKYDLFFIYSDYRDNQIACYTQYIDSLKRTVNFILVSSTYEIIDNAKIYASKHLSRSFTRDKIRKTVNIFLSKGK